MISEIAESFGLSRNTIRNWEKELSDYIHVDRDEFDNRLYSKETFRRLRQVNKLRDKGLPLATIHEIFDIMYAPDEEIVAASTESLVIAGKTASLSPPALSPSVQVVISEILNEFQNRIHAVSKEHIDSLKSYIGKHVQEVTTTQNEILATIGTRKERHKRKGWFHKK